MKRLIIAAVGLALVIGAVAVVFAVWASVDEAPWERTTSTTSPRRVFLGDVETGTSLTVCEVARQTFSEAQSVADTALKGLDVGSDPEGARVRLSIYQTARLERVLALQLINDACPSGGGS